MTEEQRHEQHLIRLRAMLSRAMINRDVYDNANGENYRKLANELRDDVYTLKWAIGELES